MVVEKLDQQRVLGMEGLIAAGLEYGDNDKPKIFISFLLLMTVIRKVFSTTLTGIDFYLHSCYKKWQFYG
jgi:hypothetical protein